MYKVNKFFLQAIPILFLIIVLIKMLYSYIEIGDRQYEFAKKESEVLNDYFMQNRLYYQKLFTDGKIDVSEQTLPILPAYSARPISKAFSESNPLQVIAKTVSDRPRNILNQADADELRAIEYFNKYPDEKEYFDDTPDEYYQFSKVLRVEQVCLKCHGKKEEAPLFIQQNYDKAYNYKLGDIRGIVSIKIPKKNLNDYFFSSFKKSIAFDFLLLFILFGGVVYILKNIKKMSEALERKINEKTVEIKNIYLYDRLTKLPNRLKLLEDIAKDGSIKHLALINVDSFNHINDLYGYEFGDGVLKEIAHRLVILAKNGLVVYKLPSDEFALLCTQGTSAEEFYGSIEGIVKEIEAKAFSLDKQKIFISFGCGIASGNEAVLIMANSALNVAKKESKDIVVYDSSLDYKEQISKNIDMIHTLKDAIKNDRIVPYFQLIYNVETKKIEKYESLVRLITADGKVLTPFFFLDIAIKSKLYPDITKVVVDKTFEYFKDKEYSFSINLSIYDIFNLQTVEFLEHRLSNYDASRVVFEILESDKIESYEEVKRFIARMKKYGCKFAIDDFGSGYSNFAHIMALNIDFLKIDGSLVKFITSDNNSRVIVKTIINFASNLGIETIAEFVEDRDSLEMLEKMGVDFTQGYHIGKPEKDIIS